jgi:hypothetical protein
MFLIDNKRGAIRILIIPSQIFGVVPLNRLELGCGGFFVHFINRANMTCQFSWHRHSRNKNHLIQDDRKISFHIQLLEKEKAR